MFNAKLYFFLFILIIMPKAIIAYNPYGDKPEERNEKQLIFHSCNADDVVYGGAKGGGKTCALTMEGVMYALTYPNSKVGLFRESYDDLEANIIYEFEKRIPEKVDGFQIYNYNQSKHTAKFFNGSKIDFRYIKDLKTAKKYQGRAYDFLGVDELTNFKKEWIQILRSCLRSPLGYPPRFRGTCNPGGIGHNWVKQDYILATDYGKKTIIDPVTGCRIVFIPAKVDDNFVFRILDKTYKTRLLNLPENLRKAFLDGDWDLFEGQFFTDYSKSKHIIEPFEIPEEWRRFRSMDWGYNDPCATYWHAIDPDGHIYTYRELYINRTLDSEAAKMIVELSQGEKIEYTVASPDAWNKTGHGDQVKGENIADTFRKNGVELIKADNSRVIGWMRMREFMKTAPDGLPWWMIFNTCHNFIRTVPDLVYSANILEDIADGQEDHCAESCRYGLMSRPRPKIIYVKPKFSDPVAAMDYERRQRMKKKDSNYIEIL